MTPQPTPPCFRPWLNRSLVVVACLAAVAALTLQSWDMFLGKPPRMMMQGNDDTFYYLWPRSAVIDHDLDFRNDLAAAPTIDAKARGELLAAPVTPAGRIRNKYPVGWAVASLPFFLAAHGTSLALGLPADGWQPIYFVFIWAGHLGYLIAGLLVARRLLAQYIGPDCALAAILVCWLSSPMVYYQTARISMAHGLVLTLLILIYSISHDLRHEAGSDRRWFALGGLAGLLVITRPLSAIYLLYPALVVMRLFRAGPWRLTLRHGLLLCVAAGTWLALLFVAWHRVFGTWLYDSYQDETFDFSRMHLADVLFSPQHGFFYWHPLLAIGAAGLLLGTIRGRLPVSWIISFGLAVALNAAWWCWWLGSSFGHRGFEGATLPLMAGWGVIWSLSLTRPRLRIPLVTLAALGISANFVLLLLYMGGAISHSDPVTYADMGRALVRVWHQAVSLL